MRSEERAGRSEAEKVRANKKGAGVAEPGKGAGLRSAF